MPITVDFVNNFSPEYLRVERTIDRFGIMELTPEQRRTAYATLQFDLLRFPSNRSRNFRFEPPREFFGYVLGMRGGRVIDYWQLEFPNQEVFVYYDSATRWQLSQQCFLSTILATQSLDVAPILMQQHSLPLAPYAQLRFRLWGEAAARFTFTYEPAQYPCKPTVPPATRPNPNANPIPGIVPPGTPITASPAYNGPNDGGLTFNPGPPIPPATADGKTYRIGYSISYVDASTGQPVTQTVPIANQSCPSSFYGPLGQAFVSAGDSGGVAVFVNGFDATGAPQRYNISGDFVNIIGTITLNSFTSQACP